MTTPTSVWERLDELTDGERKTLVDSAVTGNRLSAGPGITPQGGGLYTTFPLTITRTVIAGNQPDRCSGC